MRTSLSILRGNLVDWGAQAHILVHSVTRVPGGGIDILAGHAGARGVFQNGGEGGPRISSEKCANRPSESRNYIL